MMETMRLWPMARMIQKKTGADGILGTGPAGSFKPNALGFYDLGGDAWKWMWDGRNEKTGYRVVHGGGWDHAGKCCKVACRGNGTCPNFSEDHIGCRLVRK